MTSSVSPLPCDSNVRPIRAGYTCFVNIYIYGSQDRQFQYPASQAQRFGSFYNIHVSSLNFPPSSSKDDYERYGYACKEMYIKSIQRSVCRLVYT